MATILDNDKQYLLESWNNKIKVVSNVKRMDEESKATFARVLQNQKDALGRALSIRNESVNGSFAPASSSQLSGIDWFPQNMINMVSVLYASQIADDLVSVQALDNPIGMIRFLQYVYGDNRGSAVKGNVMIDEWGAMSGAMTNHVASPKVKGEAAGAASSAGVLDFYAQHLPIIMDSEHHLDFHADDDSLHLRLKRTSTGYEMKEVDSKGYEIPHVGLASAVVDEPSGHIVITDTGLASLGWLVDYTQDLSNVPTDAMNVELRLRTEPIKAVPHKLRANFSFDAGYAYSKSHGINIEESLINACTAEIRQERDNEIINILTRQAGLSSQWDRTVTSYISQSQHDQSFLSELFACASQINFATKHAFGNWAVVGRQGLNILNSAGRPRFEPTNIGDTTGAFVAGTLDGRMKIIYSPYVAENSYLVGYKGANAVDAGFIVGDYLPIAKTEMVMLDDFIGRQGFCSYYGTKMVNSNMYVRGTIVNGW